MWCNPRHSFLATSFAVQGHRISLPLFLDSIALCSTRRTSVGVVQPQAPLSCKLVCSARNHSFLYHCFLIPLRCAVQERHLSVWCNPRHPFLANSFAVQRHTFVPTFIYSIALCSTRTSVGVVRLPTPSSSTKSSLLRRWFSQVRACFDVRRWFSHVRACFDVRRWFHRCALVWMCRGNFYMCALVSMCRDGYHMCALASMCRDGFHRCALVSMCGDNFHRCALVSMCGDNFHRCALVSMCGDGLHRCALVSMCGDGFIGACLF